MLTLDDQPWSCGSSVLWMDECYDDRFPMALAIDCALLGEPPVKAFVDTGGALSRVGGEMARRLRPKLGHPIGQRRFTTAIGTFDGDTFRCDVTLLAETGMDLSFEVTLQLVEEWPGPPVLSYREGLDRIRIAFDPGNAPEEARIYFGRLWS